MTNKYKCQNCGFQDTIDNFQLSETQEKWFGKNVVVLRCPICHEKEIDK